MRKANHNGRSVTMTDVAKAAGVSQSTVSLIINKVPTANIPAQTQQRVLNAIKDLGYRPNAAARRMRTSKSNYIGFVTDEIATTPFAGAILQGAQDAAWAERKILLLVNTDRNQDIERAGIETILEHKVEGIIYAAMFHRPVMPPDVLHEVPTVLLNIESEDGAFPSVVPDEVDGGRTATELLLKKGHKRIAYLTYSTPTLGAVGRLEGYKLALADYGVPYNADLVCQGTGGDARSGYECTIKLFKQPHPPTALFCWNDRTAMGAYDALHDLKLSIPHDVAVVGFDNQEIIAAFLRPGLTTVQLPHYEMGRWALEYLIRHLESTELHRTVQYRMNCPLIERASV